jgi:hypothetical protein
MRSSGFGGYMLGSCVVGAVLAACGGSQPPIDAPGAMPQTSALVARTNSANYKVVYSFGALPDGDYPHSGLIGTGGTFYGTTFAGGAYNCGSSTCGHSLQHYDGRHGKSAAQLRQRNRWQRSSRIPD